MWSSCARLSATSGSVGNAASLARIARIAGTASAGLAGLNRAMAASTNGAISAPPGTRAQVVSTPSIRSDRGTVPACWPAGVCPGPSPGKPASSMKDCRFGPLPTRLVKPPRPWVLCIARLCAAMTPKDSPVTSSAPAMSVEKVGPFNGCGALPKRKEFQSTRFGCHGVSPCMSCSGKAVGSPASLKASTARMADAV